MSRDLPDSLPDERIVPADAPWLARWRAAVARNARDRFVQVATVSADGFRRLDGDEVGEVLSEIEAYEGDETDD